MKHSLSYSEMSLWFSDKDAYIRRYVEGIQDEPSQPMIIGSIIHKAIAEPTFEWVKELKEKGLDDCKYSIRKILDKMEAKRPDESEVYFSAQSLEGIRLEGIFDGWCPHRRILHEYKTTSNPSRWTQTMTDYHDQPSFYAYIYWLLTHSFFSEIVFRIINPVKGTVKTIKTARSMRDIIEIRKKIQQCHRELVEQGLWERRLSRQDREKLVMDKLPLTRKE